MIHMLSLLLTTAAIAQVARAERYGTLNQDQVGMIWMIAGYANECPEVLLSGRWKHRRAIDHRCVQLIQGTLIALFRSFVPRKASRELSELASRLPTCEIQDRRWKGWRRSTDADCVEQQVLHIQESLNRLSRSLPSGRAIWVPSGDPMEPLHVVEECPAGHETVVSDFPNPEDKTCTGDAQAPAPSQAEPPPDPVAPVTANP